MCNVKIMCNGKEILKLFIPFYWLDITLENIFKKQKVSSSPTMVECGWQKWS